MTARDAMDISAVETAGGIASLGLCRLGENVR